MKSALETSKILLDTLALQTDQTWRQEIFSGLFSPEIDYTKRALDVLSNPETVEEMTNVEWAYAFLYSRTDQVSIYPEGVFFIWEEGSRELILSFRHRISLLWLANLYAEHFSMK